MDYSQKMRLKKRVSDLIRMKKSNAAADIEISLTEHMALGCLTKRFCGRAPDEDYLNSARRRAWR